MRFSSVSGGTVLPVANSLPMFRASVTPAMVNRPQSRGAKIIQQLERAAQKNALRFAGVTEPSKSELFPAHYHPRVTLQSKAFSAGDSSTKLMSESFLVWNSQKNQFLFYSTNARYDNRNGLYDKYARDLGHGEIIEGIVVDQEKGRLIDTINRRVIIGKSGHVYFMNEKLSEVVRRIV